MRSFQNGKRLTAIVGVLLVVGVVLLGFAGSDALAQFQKTEDPGGTGESCDFCDEDECGCFPAPDGCDLTSSCNCEGKCDRSCRYDCP